MAEKEVKAAAKPSVAKAAKPAAAAKKPAAPKAAVKAPAVKPAAAPKAAAAKPAVVKPAAKKEPVVAKPAVTKPAVKKEVKVAENAKTPAAAEKTVKPAKKDKKGKVEKGALPYVSNGEIKVELIHSTAGCTERQRRTVQALGLKKLHDTHTHKDNPAIRGMCTLVAHLVKVEKIS